MTPVDRQPVNRQDEIRERVDLGYPFGESLRATMVALDLNWMLARVRDLEAALRETEDDALALLDQHVSQEVRKETRRRIIERIQARAAAAPAEKPPA